MLRAVWFLILVALSVLVVIWLIDRPGSVAVNWQGYRIETSFAVLSGAMTGLAILAALVYRMVLAIRRAPTRVGEAWRGRRRQKGYQALTRGMVAVAAGDGDEAKRQGKRADVLLNEPPLTMLLSAQAAQLNGDEQAARQFFEAMAETPETEFLGLRGLLNQALKREDHAEALGLARRAYRLRPKSDWVGASLFDLQIRNGQWLDAQITSDELVRGGVIDKTDGRRRKSVLALQQATDARLVGDQAGAAKHIKTAFDQDSAFVPAAASHVGALIDQGKSRRAAEIIEKTWRAQPHPDLVQLFWRAVGAVDGMAGMKATERLAAANPNHQESHLALARAALEARLWGEARKNLMAISGGEDNVDGHDEARVCRLWAELEEAEHEDTDAARRWLNRASLAEWDPAWVCGDCGNAVGAWSAVCGNCGSFDSFDWKTPPHVARLTSNGNLPMLRDTEGAE
ncbi:MAG: heme biosynthesis protein HemY [Rhodospirillaceae bacterium]|nr:heme biosynthesis protein HemY [Rhodospirillaceae bacterium]MBT5513805.1 heme biosynthesis protein HemY [Rhodospirillaceae bacterium]MBT6884161.1 heme biosynthesis protein HemY [Rhodospirillaceae bacterium]MBT7249678.1 heme biosynthesis protein HemY [Rhodospirillaceae bacterium]